VIASHYGYVITFNLSLGFFAVMFVLVKFSWKENYGGCDDCSSSFLSNALSVIRTGMCCYC